MRDGINNITTRRCLSPLSVADNTAQVGQIIDRVDFDTLTYLLSIGSIADADATFAVLIEHGNDSGLSDAVTVPAIDLLDVDGIVANGFVFDDDNKEFRFGYVGGKQFTRVTITPSANASAALFSAIAQLGNASRTPTEVQV